MPYPLPENEKQRLQALQKLKQLDTPAEERFDRLTRLVRHCFDAPYALLALLDRERLWIKSCQGMALSESPRETSFCNLTIMQGDILIIPDTLNDARFLRHPLVVGAEKVRFYAGIPIRASSGHRVGTLCLLDTKPRQLSMAEQQALRDFAAVPEGELQRPRLVGFEDALIHTLGKQQLRQAVDYETRTWNREQILHLMSSHTAAAGRITALARLSLDCPAQTQPVDWQLLGQCIRRAVRPGDSVGRLDTNEFLILFSNTAEEQLNEIARLLLKTIASPNQKPGEGNAFWPCWLGLTTVRAPQPLDEALSRAEKALARARRSAPFSFAMAETEIVHGDVESHLLNFTLMFAILLDGGASYSRAFQITRCRLTSEPFGTILSELEDAVVVKGQPLSQALQKYPVVFSPSYLAAVELGESTDLGKCLNRLFRELFRDYARRQQFCPFADALAAACQNAVYIIEGGGSDSRALSLAARASTDEEVRLGLSSMAEEMSLGKAILDCHFPSHFPPLFSALLVARLQVGSLSTALGEMADLLILSDLHRPSSAPTPFAPPGITTKTELDEERQWTPADWQRYRRFENELTRLIGPLAKILVRKTAVKLKYKIKSMPQALAEQIKDPEKRRAFLQACNQP